MSGGMVKVSLLAFARWDRPALHASSVGKVSVARGGPSGRICQEGQRVPRETSAQVTVSAWVHKTQARVRRAPVWGIGVSFYPRPCENRLIRHKPTVSLGVTSALVCTYGCGDGRISPTRCALIDAVLDGRYCQCRACRTPPAAAGSARSGLAAGSRPVSTVDPGGFHRSRTTPPSATTPCDDASPARCAPGTRPSPPRPCPF